MSATDSSPGVHPTKKDSADITKGEAVVDLAVASTAEEGATSHASKSTPTLFSLKDQGVLITGGARGLGLCIAIALLEADASAVYCLDILPSPDAAEWAKAEEVAKGKGSKIVYRQLNITDAEAVQQVISTIYEENDKEGKKVSISRFFGAAGIQLMCPAVDFKQGDFRRVMDINVTGMFLTIQAAAKEMIKRKIRGSIAMTASMSGTVANKGLACIAYNSSKAALLQMARCAAAEWGSHGIRINTLSPGYIRTAMTDALLAERPDFEEEWTRGSMLGRLSTPDEFRGPVLFLLSDASSFMTGADLMVDGGHTAW